MMLLGGEYPFGQFRSAVLLMFPPSFVPYPCLLAASQNGKKPDSCASTVVRQQNFGVLSTLF